MLICKDNNNNKWCGYVNNPVHAYRNDPVSNYLYSSDYRTTIVGKDVYNRWKVGDK